MLLCARKLGVHCGSEQARRLRPSQSNGGTSFWGSVFSFVKCRTRLSAQLVSLREASSLRIQRKLEKVVMLFSVVNYGGSAWLAATFRRKETRTLERQSFLGDRILQFVFGSA